MVYIFSEMQLVGNQKTQWTWYYIVVKQIGMLLIETLNNAFTALFWGWGKWRCVVKHNMSNFESGVKNNSINWNVSYQKLSGGKLIAHTRW